MYSPNRFSATHPAALSTKQLLMYERKNDKKNISLAQ